MKRKKLVKKSVKILVAVRSFSGEIAIVAFTSGKDAKAFAEKATKYGATVLVGWGE